MESFPRKWNDLKFDLDYSKTFELRIRFQAQSSSRPTSSRQIRTRPKQPTFQTKTSSWCSAKPRPCNWPRLTRSTPTFATWTSLPSGRDSPARRDTCLLSTKRDGRPTQSPIWSSSCRSSPRCKWPDNRSPPVSSSDDHRGILRSRDTLKSAFNRQSNAANRGELKMLEFIL